MRRRPEYSERGFTLREVLVATAVVGLIAAFLIPTYGPSKEERQKRDQELGPFRFEAVPARQVLQGVVDSAQMPFIVDLCEDLASKPVTLIMARKEPAEVVLYAIGFQLTPRHRVMVDHHGERMAPEFACEKGGRPSIKIGPLRR